MGLTIRGMLKSFPFLKIALPIILIILWAVLSTLIDNPFILPDIGSVLAVLANPFSDIQGSGSLFGNALVSLGRVILGFSVACVLAIPLGIVMGRSEKVHDFFDSAVQMFRPIPPLAWVPLALVWFRIGLTAMVFIIAIGAFFPVLLNTLDGVKSVKKTWIEAANTLGAGERQILSKVILPGALPDHLDGSPGRVRYRMDVRGCSRDDAGDKFGYRLPDYQFLVLEPGKCDYRRHNCHRYHRDRRGFTIQSRRTEKIHVAGT